jgi:Holliday junction DNA helicase RuvB
VEDQEEILSSNFHSSPDEGQYENVLRPKNLKEYIGQEKVKDSLSVFVRAAKIRKEPMEHVLIYGPPGLGKTTLAHVISNEMQANIKVTSGPAIERAGDLISILTGLSDSDILFIDEIHRLNKIIEEVLYPAMEDYAVDIVIGKGPSAKSLRIDLPKFTLIGATTRISDISSPMRDRFGIMHSLDFYSDKEMEKILFRSAAIIDLKIDNESVGILAKRSRRTPRIANRLLKRVGDFALVYNEGQVTKEVTEDSLQRIGIDEKGLDDSDRRYIETLLDKFEGGPVGVETISASSGIERNTIEEVIEPYLLQMGLIKRTPKGRVASSRLFELYGLANSQNKSQGEEG